MGEGRCATTAWQYEFFEAGKVLVPGLDLGVEGLDARHWKEGIAGYRELSADIKQIVLDVN